MKDFVYRERQRQALAKDIREADRNIGSGKQITKHQQAIEGVVSVYDVRPINAQDFFHTDFQNIPIAPGGTVTSILTVPRGSVMVFREYRYEISPPVFGIPKTDILLSFFVNENAVLGHTGLLHGQNTDWIGTYFFADESQNVRLVFTFPNGFAAGSDIGIEVKGNILAKRNRHLPNEIAS